MKTIQSATILLLSLFARDAWATATIDRVSVHLEPLIAEAAHNPAAFAVPVQHRVTSGESGQWNEIDGVATWTYWVRIPGAVSISFHADSLQLPSDAVLTAAAGDQVYVYTSKQLGSGSMWSHIASGDTLSLRLSLPATERQAATLSIDEFEAGYRGLGGAASHPYYRALVDQGVAATTTSCVENYECDKTSTNDGPGRATMAIVIANQSECSGTLLNDVPGDYSNYVLTARHCEDPTGNGHENPDASRLTFYWNATTACGQTLATIYSSATGTTSGATTLVEQMDGWLVKLATQPPFGVYYAGWDATGASIVGGYGIHHAGANAKQFVEWYGQAVYQTATFNGTNTSGQQFQTETAFWNVNPSLGSISHGASGSGFFDANNHLVGALTSGAGTCPTSPPTPPSAKSFGGSYTALQVIYNSTIDQSSSQPTATIAQYLDPGHTGAQTNNGKEGPTPPPAPTVTMAAAPTSFTVGSSTTLTWSSTNADSCTASGGWSGTKATSGSAKQTPTASGTVTYTLTCSNASGSASKGATVTVNPQSSSSSGGSSSSSGGSGGGGGGGGAFGFVGLAGLALAALVRQRRRLQFSRHAPWGAGSTNYRGFRSDGGLHCNGRTFSASRRLLPNPTIAKLGAAASGSPTIAKIG